MFHAAVSSKYRISVPKVYQHYSATLQTDRGPRRGMQVTVQRGDGRAPLVAQWDGISLAHKTTIGILDDQPPMVWSNRRPELLERLCAETCELCGSQTRVEVHHIRHLKDLQPKGGAQRLEWAQRMAARHRKP